MFTYWAFRGERKGGLIKQISVCAIAIGTFSVLVEYQPTFLSLSKLMASRKTSKLLKTLVLLLFFAVVFVFVVFIFLFSSQLSLHFEMRGPQEATVFLNQD